MGSNTFGHHLQFHSFGESHGEALGCVIEGCPAGLYFSPEFLQTELDRRRPGRAAWVSARNESDQAEILSGVYQNKTLGTPICVMIRNQNQKSSDYREIENQIVIRSGHADDVWKNKFSHVDLRGGGRSSGRETVARVIAGAFAKMILQQLAPQLNICAFAESIGPLTLSENDKQIIFKKINESSANQYPVDSFIARFPYHDQNQVEELLLSAKNQGNSWGGKIHIHVSGMIAGLGQPVFHKLKSDISQALMSVGAVAGVVLGDLEEKSFSLSGIDFHQANQTQQYGGIRGGISTGEDLIFKVLVKPTSSIMDVAKKGRHDPCIIPRAIPVLEAMLALVLADHLLLTRLDQLKK